jgi:hypothetical protein
MKTLIFSAILLPVSVALRQPQTEQLTSYIRDDLHPGSTPNKLAVLTTNSWFIAPKDGMVFSTDGRCIRKGEHSGEEHIIDLSDATPGIYLVRILNNKKTYTSRIVKI